MNKIGMYFAFWTQQWRADYLYYLNKVADLGFDILEVVPAQLLEVQRSELDTLKKAAADRNVEITYCIGFPADKDMASEDAAVRRSGIEYAKQILDVVSYMGGKVFGGINYTSWPGNPGLGITDKRPQLERSAASIRQVAKTAQDLGILYCLEVVNRYEQYLINTVSEGVAFAREVGSPNVKLLLDIFHMNIEEDDMGEAIIAAGDYLGHFHIGETNRKPPGLGRMPWQEIADALKKIGYTGRVVMEPFMKMGGQVGKDIRVWHDQSENTGEAQMDKYAKDALIFMRNLLQ